ncbi:MAG: cytochrome c [Gammaproteobacteria bacterium]|nr:cytochrome c [Gammaproteobacteria bacterium]
MRLLALAGVLLAATAAAQDTQVQRGAYLLQAGGCITCHTAKADDAIPLAGGRALESPFGTFYAPNITPDRDTGIGNWTDEEFVNAFWEGVGPGGKYYFPAFPYPSYTGMTRDDLLAIKAYLFSLEPVPAENREHELPWYLDTRLAAAAWQSLKFSAGRFTGDPERNDEWNRGAYLVRHLGHCGECHTPRDRLGATISGQEMAGVPPRGDNKGTPNITPHPDDGIGKWRKREIELFLELGLLPDGDFVGGSMAPVIDDNTGLLTPGDRAAIATYLQGLPALPRATAAE